MKHTMKMKTAGFIKEIRREDFWILPFTFMTIVLAGYAATTNKKALWWLAACIIGGMLVFTSLLIALKYNHRRGVLHATLGSILLILAARIGLTLM